jgi:NAD-dependent deacetylase
VARQYQLSPKRLEMWKGEWRAKGELAFPGKGARTVPRYLGSDTEGVGSFVGQIIRGIGALFMLAVSPVDRIFVLTGAGVSAESGIPTFRGVNGLWRNYRIEEVASPDAWHRDPRLVWEFYSMRRRVGADAKPNPAHFVLAKLEQKLQDRLFLCTQNVDDLHEQAGLTHVVHMHGELFKSRCDTCSRPPFRDTNTYDPPAELPRCNCGGRIRPHICWFGEVPFELNRILRVLDECTASLVAQVGGRARTIYVGEEEPANASAFTECHLGKAGGMLTKLLGASCL